MRLILKNGAEVSIPAGSEIVIDDGKNEFVIRNDLNTPFRMTAGLDCIVGGYGGLATVTIPTQEPILCLSKMFAPGGAEVMVDGVL